jgi:hypothetical protein
MIVERIDSFAARWRESYPGAVRVCCATGLRLLQDLRRSLLEPPTRLPERRTDTGAAPPETVGAIA